MQMPGRTYTANTSYRYGFNGKEMDNEPYGQGNEYDYGMRIYNPRTARFFSVDPIAKEYPELTPYQYASNRPIDGIDRDGLEYSPAGLFGPNGPRDGTAVQTMPLNAAEVQKVNTQSAARVNYLNQWIIAPDIFGNGYIGPRYAVQANIAITKHNYYNAVGDNIANGPGGAIGYLIADDKGSFIGAAGDQIMYSFGGLDSKGYLSKLRVNVVSEPDVKNATNETLYQKYKANRPKLLQTTINKAWEDAKDVDGNVYDPNTGESLTWNKFKSRYDQWHMGHKPGHEYKTLLLQLKNGTITEEQFKKEFNNPDNYQPESPSANMSHQYEQKPVPLQNNYKN